MKKYLSFFFPFVLVLGGILAIYLNNVDAEASLLSWAIFLYFVMITLAFHFGIVQTTKSRPQVFIRYFMAATTIKLFLHLVIIVTYSLFHRELATRFILTFMVMYLFCTVFEVMSVWRRTGR